MHQIASWVFLELGGPNLYCSNQTKSNKFSFGKPANKVAPNGEIDIFAIRWSWNENDPPSDIPIGPNPIGFLLKTC